MDTNKGEILYPEESHEIVGCAMAVHNEIGHGFHEKPYENALVVEFGHRKIPVDQQRAYELTYREVKVGEYIPDLVVFGKIIVDTKVIEKITQHEIGQMMNYLKISGLRLGYIINFRHAKLEWKRVAN